MTDNNDNNNVVDLVKKKQEKADKTSDGKNPPKLSAWEKQALIADWLNGLALDFKKPINTFAFLTDQKGEKKLYRITNEKELVACDMDWVADTIAHAVHNEFRHHFDIVDRQISGAARYWSMVTPAIEPPPLFAFSGTDHLVTRRVPLELFEGPTPLWDEMMSRVTNSQALMAWIGSLFAEESDRQQYVWLHGQGNDGKGSLARFLKRALGHVYTSQEPPSLNDRFWTWSIKDARLVVFEDCNNTGFVTTGLFKSLTGGDWVRAEIKGGKVLSIQPKAKYLFLSNEKPDLSSERADTRRVIYCTISKFFEEADGKYEQGLWHEGGRFLYKCMKMYDLLCPNYQSIKCHTDTLDEVISANEEKFSSFLENNFIVGPAHQCRPHILQELLNKEFKSKKEQKDFRAFMERQGIKRVMKRCEDKMPRYIYVGLKPRSMSLSSANLLPTLL
jgi:hypothetical protein